MENDRYIIYQFPNPPLWVMLGAALVGRLSAGPISSIASIVYYIAGIIWAYEEIANGVNLFRRILGSVVLLGISYSMYMGAST